MPNTPTGFDTSDVESDKVPRVPIKTYKWEDVKRARLRGGYPWTYLYKEAFNESIYPERFRMEGIKKSKTSCASSASDSLDIKEITEDDIKGLEGIDSSYVVIESPILLGRHLDEPVKEQEGIVESADSSDNISQYLDKEERGPEQQLESTETLTLPIASDLAVQQTDRARSEEPQRKRRLSVESNYSRISLSKLGLMKTLKNAKEKIKLPKFSDKIGNKNHINEKREDKRVEEPMKESSSKKHEKPVYIHIPLKPPEGERDEFSHLEFEETKKAVAPGIEIQITEESTSEQNTEDVSDESGQNMEEMIAESGSHLVLNPPNDQEDDVSAIIFLEAEEGSNDKGEYDIIAVDIDENSQEMKMSQITNTEVRRQVLESIKKVESQPDISKNSDNSNVHLSRSSSKASRTSKTSIRKRRAKSVETEKKRRLSIDSSYSRKSMSKIGLLKKLKQFHIPFLKSQSKKSVNIETLPDTTEVELPRVQHKQNVHGEQNKPVYIHIPLKPPEGETDEFSHLEFHEAPPPQPKIERSDTTEPEDSDMSPVDTPQTSKSPQFIILTPPSDDELLDKHELPETPSCESASLSQIKDLQELARNTVDHVNSDLGSVAEASYEGSENKIEAMVDINIDDEGDEEDKTQNKGKLTIDEEDGLKSIPPPNDEIRPNLRSNLKGENSPLPKKKVSFKRRKSSQASKDDGYEEIESPPKTPASVQKNEVTSEDAADVSPTESIVSAPPLNDDQKNQKKISTNYSEEKEGRWSKISDHEYEPINPPPEEKTEVTPPKSHVSEVLNPSSRQAHEYSDDDLHSTHIQSSNDKNLPSTRSAESRSSPSKRSSRSRSRERSPSKPNKFQAVIRESATKFKTKLQGIKKPSISMPSRPKLQRPNFKKPNITLPKLPDISSTFRMTSKLGGTKTIENKEVQDSDNKGIFDFSTYPRIFGKKKRDADSVSLKENVAKTEKQIWPIKNRGPAEIIRIPLHSEDSMDQENGIFPQPEEILEVSQIESCEVSSPQRYQEDIEVDDEEAAQLERQQKHKQAVAAAAQEQDTRWDHGNFFSSRNNTEITNKDEENTEETEEILTENHDLGQMQPEMVTDLDLPDESEIPSIPVEKKSRLQQNDSFETNHSRDVGSSISSLGLHRRGVIEEIDSDQFFLREEGLSQDNIDMGKYLSTEIRDAFRSPTNALADINSYNYEEIRSSNQSLPETKRKQVKKPKRRKTPHTSQERLRYDPESENEDYNFMPPIRPKRKSRRKKRLEPEIDTIPFVETKSIEPVEEIKYIHDRVEDVRHYENDNIGDIDSAEPHSRHQLHVLDLHDAHRRASEPIPAAPPRKHKSLKSLNASEHDSIFEEYGRNEDENNMRGYENQGISMSSGMDNIRQENNSHIQQISRAPKAPTRCRSKTRSMSRTTLQADRDSILGMMDSIMFDEESREPVIEETCIKDLRDAMGYAIVDKNQNKNWEHKFCTVPRSRGNGKPPERPLRNYSTLGPSRPERKLSKNMTDEEKENIDISQYIEIEDERDLQSGEIIQKIQNRPLPAPPRPPRSRSKPLSDVTATSNIDLDQVEDVPVVKLQVQEIEVSTQTEPLPPDFECEEMIHEETDKMMTPSALRKSYKEEVGEIHITQPEHLREIVLNSPIEHSYVEETITHGQLLVEPLNGARILPDSDITASLMSDEGETSEIPEHFNNLSDPKMRPSLPINCSEVTEELSRYSDINKENHSEQKNTHLSLFEVEEQQSLKDESTKLNPEEEPREEQRTQTTEQEEGPIRPSRQRFQKGDSFEVLKTHKLQVSDLDVDRLTVNELVATKIVVSEIEGQSINSNEINSKGGTLKLSDLELKPDIVKKLLEQLKEVSKAQNSESNNERSGVEDCEEQVEQKKTPTDYRDFDETLSNTVATVLSEESSGIQAPFQKTSFGEELTSEHSEPSSSNFSPTNNGSSQTKKDENELMTQDFFERENLASRENLSELVVEENISNAIMNSDTEHPTQSTFCGDIERVVYEAIVEPEVEEEQHSKFRDMIGDNEVEMSKIDSSKKSDCIISEPPIRPPRFLDKKQIECTLTAEEDVEENVDSRNQYIADSPEPEVEGHSLQLMEPEVDDEPPPRPPQPKIPYIPSEPPAEFFELRAQKFVDDLPDDIPLVPRRHRNNRSTRISRSSSSESSNVRIARRRIRSPEPSIPQLTCQLVGACTIVARNKLKKLLDEINSNISKNTDAENNMQNIQVIVVVLLILIAILLLMGFGFGRTVHFHHWEYFNPPTDV